MKSATDSGLVSPPLVPRQMGKIGIELLAKATACAVAIALLAGITAALFGS